MSRSALARRLGLSPPTAASRVARLERLGVIRGYNVDLDPQALGWLVMGLVQLCPRLGQGSKVAELATWSPQVAECQRVTGEDSLLLLVHVESMQGFEQIVDRFRLHGHT